MDVGGTDTRDLCVIHIICSFYRSDFKLGGFVVVTNIGVRTSSDIMPLPIIRVSFVRVRVNL